MKRELNIINRAVEEFDYELDLDMTIKDTLDECENIIFENVDYDLMDECELCKSGSNQYYSYNDGNGYSKDVTGDIFDFPKKGDVYFSIADKKFINWFDLPTDEDERHEYGFIFDRVINNEGKVVLLYDRL